jgi:hypothetical protein
MAGQPPLRQVPFSIARRFVSMVDPPFACDIFGTMKLWLSNKCGQRREVIRLPDCATQFPRDAAWFYRVLSF